MGLKYEVELPKDIHAKVNGIDITIKGPAGEVSRKFPLKNVKFEVVGNEIVITTKKLTRNDKRDARTSESHIKSMIDGALEKHKYVLRICSGHFPMTVTVSGQTLTVKNFLGEKVPRQTNLHPLATVRVDQKDVIVESCDKEVAGQVASRIEHVTNRPNFDKRVFQDGIFMVTKAKKGAR